ncbi:Ig-like domain-containing protein [Mucilaginibacter sp. 21P]|uniref:Ig-like domain-containing protein n=1 Tax=Mucilaginibacter sp. 21P TaxID=2778902 RepID=UPI001C5A1D34|nr:Ig-like domain-containing protein [Mucilaginibacter sp. 21P]QXV66669.1 Ig-like domain-containing protein [Mucilaginibacter sp. 21P]
MKRFFLILLYIIPVMFSGCVKNAEIQPDAITLNYTDLTLQVGSGKQLLASKYDATQIIWTSSDNTVASIDEKGVIVALKEGTTTMTAKSKQHNITAICQVKVIPMVIEGKDIGIGADGSVFIIGTDSTSAGSGYSISKLVNNKLTKLPDCGAVRVAVTPDGTPWVINKDHKVLKYSGTAWIEQPGTATDIAIGANGAIFAIGNIETSPTGGNNIMSWTGSNWENKPDCAGTRIAVAPDGIPWVVNKSNIVYRYGGTYLWEPFNNILASDIGIGANGSVFVVGKLTSSAASGIFKFDSYYRWQDLNLPGGTNIAVTPDGKAWWLDATNVLHKQQ